MHYDFTAIPDADVPQAVEPIFQHVLQTYASEANKTASVWRAVPDALLDFKPHAKVNPIRTILVHQLLSERRDDMDHSAWRQSGHGWRVFGRKGAVVVGTLQR